LLRQAIKASLPRPPETASRAEKKNYSERLSNEVAKALSERLRQLGVTDCQPGPEGGKERQFAGGLGAKKVDVSFATDTAGLILGISVKSICFPDGKSKNYAKNLTNRRGDLLSESTTLDQRFPFAVLGGLFVFHIGAERDGTGKRPSTVQRAHEMFRGILDRKDRANAFEKFEAMGIVVFDDKSNAFQYRHVGSEGPSGLDEFLQRLLEKVVERNPDHYRLAEGKLTRAS